MPIQYARSLTSHASSQRTIRQLGFTLAFIAGAANAGGFLAVQIYTSHMTGIVSSMADNLVLGDVALVLNALGGLMSFIAGAATSAILVNYARRRQLQSEYAFPLLLEAALMLCFGLLGARLSNIEGLFVPATVMLLCFMMGLQNAVISKLSNAEIRTTHVTGIITDIGIELGKLAYWNRHAAPGRPDVLANRPRLRVLSIMALSFLGGGVLGALSFNYVGYIATVPLALLLVSLAAVPVFDDLRQHLRR